MTDTIIQLPIDELHESPFNPRKVFDEASLQELATDIQQQGRVLSPLLVRPRIGPLFEGMADAAAGHEVVFGHRRLRAAQLAGLLDVPCMVHAMTDAEARRAQISENLQRKDVHPIEEAEGFQALIDEDGISADAIAAQFGKSRSYVYGRLKLLEACAEIRRACLAGEIGSEVALLVARLRTIKNQEKALEYIRKDYGANLSDGGKHSYRRIRDLLNEKFSLDLKKAMFDIEEEMLVPSAGNCITCPKRSANAPEFADVVEPNMQKAHGYRVDTMHHEGPDVCTDPDCFESKKKAYLQREAKALEATGKTVVAGNAARAAISATGQIKGAYIALKDVAALIKSVKGSAAAAVDTITILDPRTGKTHKAVKREDLKAAGVKLKEEKPATSSSYSNDDDRKRQKENEAAAEVETKVRTAIFNRVLEALSDKPRDVFDLQLLAIYSLDMLDYDSGDCLRAAYGVKDMAQLLRLVADMMPGELSKLMLAIALSHEVEINAWELEAPAKYLMTAAKQYDVDVDQVRAEVTGVVPPPALAARAPKKAKAGADKAAPAAAKPSTKGKGKGLKQKDDAGDAGGSDGQADLLEETES